MNKVSKQPFFMGLFFLLSMSLQADMWSGGGGDFRPPSKSALFRRLNDSVEENLCLRRENNALIKGILILHSSFPNIQEGILEFRHEFEKEFQMIIQEFNKIMERERGNLKTSLRESFESESESSEYESSESD